MADDTPELATTNQAVAPGPTRIWPLLAAAFTQACCVAILATALPFFAQDLGGKGFMVGLIGAAGTGTYALGCALMRPVADRLSPRPIATAGVLIEIIVMVAMAHIRSLAHVLVLFAAQGLAMSLFWPLVMGWICSGAEGQTLNRRLARFNLTWCTALMVGPFIGGALFELGQQLPFYAAAACLVLTVGLLAMASAPVTERRSAAESKPRSSDETAADSSVFRYTAWVSLFFAYMILGMCRFQLPILARVLHIREAVFGIVMGVLSLAMTVSFVMLGRTDRWHYRRGFHVAAQLLMAATVIALCWTNSATFMTVVVTVAGLCIGLSYTSSIYYSASRAGRRLTSRLAVHEMTLASGVVCGSFLGGLLTQSVHLRAAYPACAVLVLIGLLIQLLITHRARDAAA